MLFGDGQSARPAKHHQVQQRVGSQPISTMYRARRSFSTCVQPGHYGVGVIARRQHLRNQSSSERCSDRRVGFEASSVTRDCTHVTYTKLQNEHSLKRPNVLGPCSSWVRRPCCNAPSESPESVRGLRPPPRKSSQSRRYQATVGEVVRPVDGAIVGRRGPFRGPLLDLRQKWKNPSHT